MRAGIFPLGGGLGRCAWHYGQTSPDTAGNRQALEEFVDACRRMYGQYDEVLGFYGPSGESAWVRAPFEQIWRAVQGLGAFSGPVVRDEFPSGPPMSRVEFREMMAEVWGMLRRVPAMQQAVPKPGLKGLFSEWRRVRGEIRDGKLAAAGDEQVLISEPREEATF